MGFAIDWRRATRTLSLPFSDRTGTSPASRSLSAARTVRTTSDGGT